MIERYKISDNNNLADIVITMIASIMATIIFNMTKNTNYLIILTPITEINPNINIINISNPVAFNIGKQLSIASC